MIGWEREPFDLINEGLFRVTNPGPLRSPIHSFSIHRSEKLKLIVETSSPPDAKSTAKKLPSGTLQFNAEIVELTNIAGWKAVLSGVQTYTVKTAYADDTKQEFLKEKARIHRIDVLISADEKPAYTIDWLDNVPSLFVWPDTIKTSQSTVKTRNIAFDAGGITLTSSETKEGFGKHTVRFAVGGVDIFLCQLDRQEASDRLKPGCIIYRGTPDEEFRKRVRNALSFALGAFLVDLGSVVYTDTWKGQSFHLKSAYSIGRRAFDLPVLHPAPLHLTWQHGIERPRFHRMVNSIVGKYDELDFGNLAWAYWHALCATPHIAGVHFGAVIEALQRCYIDTNPKKIQTAVIPDGTTWGQFRAEIERVIAELNIPEEAKAALRQNIGSLNNVGQRSKMESVLREINIALGPDETLAWKRRNDAAHGNELEPGGEVYGIHGRRHRWHRRLEPLSDKRNRSAPSAGRPGNKPVPTHNLGRAENI